MNALNPKVSLLIKLGQACLHTIQLLTKGNEKTLRDRAILQELMSDDEVLDWLERMVELQYIPAQDWLRKAIQVEPSPVAIASFESLPRRGFQIFAESEQWPSPGGIASFTEATSVQIAMAKCIVQFPVDEGYSGHGVKDIETQEITLLRPWEGIPPTPQMIEDAGPPSDYVQKRLESFLISPDSERLDSPKTVFPGEPEPLPLSLELEPLSPPDLPPPLSLD